MTPEIWLEEFLRESEPAVRLGEIWPKLIQAGPEFQIAALFASRAIPSTGPPFNALRVPRKHALRYLRKKLLELDLPLTLPQLTDLVDGLETDEDKFDLLKLLIPAITSHSVETLPSATRKVLEKVIRECDRQAEGVPYRYEDRDAIADYLGLPRGPGEIPSDVWYQQALSDIAGLSPVLKNDWAAVLSHAAVAIWTQPGKGWAKDMAELLAKLPAGEFEQRFLVWTQLISEPRPGVRPPPEDSQLRSSGRLVELKGLVWATISVASDAIVLAVSRLAEEAFRKVPGEGAVSIAIGNACLNVLGETPLDSALEQLTILKSRLKLPTARKTIKKALESAAARRQTTAGDLVESAVSTCGLTDVGLLESPLGPFTARISIDVAGDATMVWLKADGKLQKCVPAAIKSDHPAELQDLKTTMKTLERTLTAQRERLDDLFLQRQSWISSEWRERYLDHFLVGTLTRRLIWTFKNTGLESSGIWLGDTIVSVDDEPIAWVDAEGTTVELWHPIGRPMDDVLAWRQWLERHEIRQPFKQAHREIYVLTDAERRTQTYSNRYAAQVLRQHQFNALCASRGWANKLRLAVDSDYSAPAKRLETWGLRAEFWVDTLNDHATDVTTTGVYRYLSTDQVRFYRLEADRHVAHATGGRYVTEGLDIPVNQPLPLELIPPIVFSEVMRDVDLFVGVASVGNDPTWEDGGADGRFREYWRTCSFADLTPSAQTRKQVLERLVPRLKIGPRCSFSEKFLVVRGDLRTYKIHLGSGNILMQPNDEYLCIVPDSSAVLKRDNVFLPFEGDRTLSIILSKAMLLADDGKITDPTIKRQIKSA